MSEGSVDLTGQWRGHYGYRSESDGFDTSFTATITHIGENLVGTVEEEDVFDPGNAATATIAGTCRDGRVDFVKTYTKSAWPDAEPVDYRGDLAPDGTVISGSWSLEFKGGTFTMQRQG